MYYLLENGKIVKRKRINAKPKNWLIASYNVYDFINKYVDLVEVDGQIIMAKHINGDITKMSNISAIYKPDAKGNYIKVWEVKEDE